MGIFKKQLNCDDANNKCVIATFFAKTNHFPKTKLDNNVVSHHSISAEVFDIQNCLATEITILICLMLSFDGVSVILHFINM